MNTFQIELYGVGFLLGSLGIPLSFLIWADICFSYKVFAINYSLKYIGNEDFLIWTDADLRCKKDFSSDDLIQFMPEENQLMSYLGRTEFPPERPYSECGFLGFNIKHPHFKDFLGRMVEIYTLKDFDYQMNL